MFNLTSEFKKKHFLLLALSSVLVSVTGLLFFWSLLRFYLFFSHFNTFKDIALDILFFSFLNGARFDLSAIFYVNAIFFLLLLYQKSNVYKILFVFLNSLLGLLHLADVEYFGLVGRRLDRSFLSIVSETNMTSYSSFLYQYWSIFVFAILFVLYFYFLNLISSKFVFEVSFQKFNKATKKKYSIFVLCVLLIATVCIRGGFQRKPLAIIHAYDIVGGDGVAANLSLNTIYNFIRSQSKTPFPNYYRNAEIPFSTDKKFKNTDTKVSKKPKNIIFIFIESLSTYSVNLNQKSAIKDFASKNLTDSIYIPDNFANGRFSMDALTSVFLGVPSFFKLHLFKSNFAQNKWIGMGKVLKEKGFKTFFIHAAKPGTMYFDKIAAAVGISDFYALAGKDKNIPDDMIASWGVHDEYMYEKSIPIVDNYKDPFMGVLFSVSSHFNYENTPGDATSTGSREEKYHRTIDYAERSLKNYFESVKDKQWFKETLFIVTGDHSPPLSSSWLQSAKEKSRVPLLLYFPDSNIGVLERNKAAQHLDLPHTVFDLLNVEPLKWSPFGKSIFDTSSDNLIGYYWNQDLNFIEGKCLNTISTIDHKLFKSTPRFKNAECLESYRGNKIEKYRDFIKSYVNRLEKNRMYE